jgi:hypothetical protein
MLSQPLAALRRPALAKPAPAGLSGLAPALPAGVPA